MSDRFAISDRVIVNVERAGARPALHSCPNCGSTCYTKACQNCGTTNLKAEEPADEKD